MPALWKNKDYEVITTNGNLEKSLRMYVPVKLLKNGKEEPFPDPKVKFDLASYTLVFPSDNSNSLPEKTLEEFEIYRGKTPVLVYDFGTRKMPHSETDVEVKGSLEFINTLGTTPHADIVLDHLKTSKQVLLKTLIDLKVVKEGTKFHKAVDHQSTMAAAFCSMVVSGPKLNTINPFVLLMMIFNIIDDIVVEDTMNQKNGKIKSTVASTSYAIKVFCAAIRGEKTEETDLENPNNPLAKDFPKLVPIYNSLLELRSQVIAVAKVNNLDPKHFIEAFAEYLVAMTWEKMDWLNMVAPTDELLEQEMYFTFREATIGVIPCIELVALMKNIQITEAMRKDPLVKLFLLRVSRAVAYENDIASYDKEVIKEETENIFMIKDKNATAKTASDIYQHSVRQNHVGYNLIRTMESKLLERYDNDAGLAGYLQAGTLLDDANKRWSWTTDRYLHPGDCHISIIM